MEPTDSTDSTGRPELSRLTRHFALPEPAREGHEGGVPGDGAREPAPVAVDWDAVESWLGLRLPADYKALVTAYGPLDIGEFVWLHAPCVQEGRFDYGDWLRETHRETRIDARDLPGGEQRTFHPAPGGLLAWGGTRGAAAFFWDTSVSEDPDAWPVVLFDRDQFPSPDPDAEPDTDPWYPLGTNLTGTLTALLTTGLPMRGSGRFGPLPATARRTAFLPDPAPWTPPPPRAPHDPARRAALTEGEGLAALTALVPPPAAPYLGGGTWERLYEELGTRLPAEYVALLERYGAGGWAQWLRFHTPLREGTNGFVWHARQVTDAYRSSRRRFPEHNPLAVWPEPGGFLPFANSIDADEIGWLTQGTPDEWPVIVRPRHARQGPPLTGTLTGILLEWLRGRFSTEGFVALDEDDDPLDVADFEPWSDAAYW